MTPSLLSISRDEPRSTSTLVINKVPQITALFWLTKLLTTGGGEAASDFFLTSFNQPLVLALTTAAFVGVMGAQLRVRRYVPWLYWLNVSMVAVFGTELADVVYFIGAPYQATCLVLAAALVAIFIGWKRTQGTLSIHEINTRPREWFYWGTVLTTFAFGTSIGDLAAGLVPFGFLGAGVAFAVVIAVPGLSYRFLGLSAVAAFWGSYILTRPLGASIADWLAVPGDRGGLGIGTGAVALVSLIGVVALVAHQSRLTIRAASVPLKVEGIVKS